MDVDDKEVRIVAVVLTLNQKDKTIKFLENLRLIREPHFDVLLWDNGSTDGTAEAVEKHFPEVAVYRHPENLGVGGGRNGGARLVIAKFDATHLLFLDNDLKLEPGFVRELYRPFQSDSMVGQTQAKLRFMNDPQRLNDGGGNRIRFWLGKTEPVGIGEIDRGQYDTVRSCVAGGGAMMVRRDVFEQLGGFDECFGFMGPEDLDFSLRLQKTGFKSLFIPQALAFHEVSNTFGKGYIEPYARLKSYNWLVFLRRHATFGQKVAFFLFGLPYLATRVIVREVRRGNPAALRGLLRGLGDFLRPRER